MRLEEMSFTDYITAEFDLRERQRKERMKKAEFEKYAKEHNIFYCTKELGEQIKVETPPILEKIRAEIEELDRYYDNDYFSTNNCPMYKCNEVLQIIDNYAEQEPTDEWQNGYDRGWEEAKVFYEEEPCDDAVSREAVIEILENYGCTNKEGLLFKDIRDLPSVRPQEQTGHWIKKDGYSDCSECGSHIVTEWDYCPKCGAKMIEPQESESDVK